MCQGQSAIVRDGSSCGSTSSGTLYTLDKDGNLTSQTPDTGATISWTGQWYYPPSTGTEVASLSLPGIDFAPTGGAIAGGSPSPKQIALPSLQSRYRNEIARLARRYVGNTQRWNERYGGNKCNLFVHDVLDEAAQSQDIPSLLVPQRPPKYWDLQFFSWYARPISAADWATTDKPIACWNKVPGGPDDAQPGDILATGWPPGGNDDTGHVGIVVAPEQGIVPNLRFVSASSVAPYFWPPLMKQSFVPGTITVTDYGFRSPGYAPEPPPANQGLKADSKVRRFSCY